MKEHLFWKSLIRRRGSLLLLALTVIASFGFMLRMVEYLSVSQAIAQISEEYRPIGTLSSSDGIITEGITLVQESPYVELADVNRGCPAILSDVYNVDLDAISDTEDLRISELLVWGEVTLVRSVPEKDVMCYDVRIVEGVLGYPEYIETGKMMTLEVPLEAPLMEPGKTYLIQGSPSRKNNVYYNAKMTICLKPLVDGIWFLEESPNEETAGRYIDEDALFQERNRHAMVAITTRDMSLHPLVQEVSRDFYLEEGRWLNRQDQEEGRKVCLVSKEFADIRGLSVGDTLTVTFQNRELERLGYTLHRATDTWETGEKTEAVLEIVGVYGRLWGGMVNEPGWASLSTRNNNIYIPDSCIPEHYVKDCEVTQDMFSFVLKDPRQKDAFLQEMWEKLASLGISVTFVEDNWDSFYQSAKALKQSGFYSLLIFTAVLVVALGAVSFLYTWQRKKEAAIARALGVPAKKAAVSSCLPMMVLSGLGILSGGGLGWKYGVAQAGRTLSGLGVESPMELSMGWFAGVSLLAWLLSVLMLLGESIFHAGRPVLYILQGGTAVRRKEGGKETVFQEEGSQTTISRETAISLSQSRVEVPGKGLSMAAMLRFVRRCFRVFSLRTVFALLAAVVFSLSSCWLWHSIKTGEEQVGRLYRSVVVEAQITKLNDMASVSGHGEAYITGWAVEKMLETGFVKEHFLVGGAQGYVEKSSDFEQEEGENSDSEKMKASFLGIADMEQYLSLPGNMPQVFFESGFGADWFKREYGAGTEAAPVILPESLWKEWEVQAGDTLWIENEGESAVNVVAGGYYDNTGMAGGPLMVPMSLLEVLEGDNLCYSTAIFLLDQEKNQELEEFRQKSQEITEAPQAGLLKLSFVIWDGELRQIVEPMEKNITLMKILYPLANGGAFLIAAGLSVLFLFQRRREAAILRVLGVGIFPARGVLILELMILDLAGLLLGTGLTAFLMGVDGLFAMPVAAGCFFIGCLVGTVAGAVLVTRGRPLELLQGKE